MRKSELETVQGDAEEFETFVGGQDSDLYEDGYIDSLLDWGR